MPDLNLNLGIVSTGWAEGTLTSFGVEPVDSRSIQRSTHLSLRNVAISPKPVTGLMEVVMHLSEGNEHDEAQDAGRTVAEIRSAAEVEFDADTPRGLIVEDAFELAEILQITLRRMKIAAVHESYGNRALERFYAIKPQIVLLDISLPDIPGWEVLEKIKEHSRATGERMPAVIVITAFGDPANRLVGKLHGVFRYLIKPFTPREVEQVVKEALNTFA